jgi:hypothetical protein
VRYAVGLPLNALHCTELAREVKAQYFEIYVRNN